MQATIGLNHKQCDQFMFRWVAGDS